MVRLLSSACSNFVVMFGLALLAIHFLWDPFFAVVWGAIGFLTNLQ